MFGKKVYIKIEGMSCNHCAKKIQDSLKCIDNVKGVKINLNDKIAVITYRESIDLEKVKSIIEELGYKYIDA